MTRSSTAASAAPPASGVPAIATPIIITTTITIRTARNTHRGWRIGRPFRVALSDVNPKSWLTILPRPLLGDLPEVLLLQRGLDISRTPYPASDGAANAPVFLPARDP